VLAISIGVLPNLSQPAQEQISAPVPAATAEQAEGNEVAAAPVEEVAVEEVVTEAEPVETEVPEETITEETALASDTQPATQTSEVALASVTTVDPEREVLEGFLRSALDVNTARLLSSNTVASVAEGSNLASGNLVLTNGTGLTSYLSFDLATEQGIQHAWFTIALGGNEFAAVPQAKAAQLVRNSDGSAVLYFIATDLLIGDTKGSFDFIATDKTAVSTGALRIQINFDAAGQVSSSSISLTPRT
jgi:hypothetical protein